MTVVQVVLALLVGAIFGAFIMYSSMRFRKSTGVVLVDDTGDERMYTLQLEEEPEDFVKRKYVLFRVSKHT